MFEILRSGVYSEFVEGVAQEAITMEQHNHRKNHHHRIVLRDFIHL